MRSSKRFFMFFLLILLFAVPNCKQQSDKQINSDGPAKAEIISDADFTILTEEFPPFNYKENELITGVSTEIVQEIFNNAGFKIDIKILPWARAYQTTQDKVDTMLYSTGRNPEREHLFKWIGPIIQKKYSLFALSNRKDIVITSFEDIKKYKTGTTRNDAREIYLMSKGFEIGTHLDSITNEDPNSLNFKKLQAHRIDLWPMPDAVAYYLVKQTGGDPAEILKKVFELQELSADGYYLAVNVNTDQTKIDKLQNVLNKFKKTKKYADILKKYNL